MSEVNELAVVRVELADRVRLFLREDHAAIGRADDAIRGFEIGPDELPFRAGRDHARNIGDGRGPLAGQLLRP